MTAGPSTVYSQRLHAEKYRLPGESFEDGARRVAAHLSDTEAHRRTVTDILAEMRFLPAGRIQTAIGAPKQVTPYNCFVASTIHDSFVHGRDDMGRDSIMDVARQAATTMRLGGGIGYDFSPLRPSKDLIEGVQSYTDGPCAFLPIYDAECRATSSAGNRRGAQMGVLRIDHPDIRKFINVKQPSGRQRALWDLVESLPADHPNRMEIVSGLQETLPLTGFNLSIAVTDEFMECLATGRPFPLKFGGRVYSEVDPQQLWDEIMEATWNWAEPGVLFIDTINKMNNLYYCETIAATNPCGEQPLPPNGACLLGSFNLTKYITGTVGDYGFDWSQFVADIDPVVRMMDNVVDYALYPLDAQEREAKAKRRMGLGVTGLANAAEALGKPYGSTEFLGFERLVLAHLRDHSYQASVRLAREKGAFPLYAPEYLGGRFIQTLDSDLQSDIKRHGTRNSHLTSMAPTGTISLTADNVSGSAEPVIYYEAKRKVKMLGGEEVVDVDDYGYRFLGVRGKLAHEVTAQEHVAVLTTAQAFVDSAVSKTCNVSPDMPRGEFQGLYRLAWEGGAKGCTTFNPGGKRLGIFEAKRPAVAVTAVAVTAVAVGQDFEGPSCRIDENGRRSCE